MRSNVFRTDVINVPITTLTNIFTKNMDGMGPFVLYVENVASQAEFIVRDVWGSPSSSIRYKAVTAGSGGNAKRVQVLQHATNNRNMSQSINVNDVTYTFGTAVAAWEAVNFIQANSGASGVTAELTNPYSGGLAPMGFLAALTNLAGGVDSTVTGVIAFETAPTAAGPWVAVSGNDPAAAAPSPTTSATPATLAGSTQFSRFFPNVMGLFRLNITGGAAATKIVATAVLQRTDR